MISKQANAEITDEKIEAGAEDVASVDDATETAAEETIASDEPDAVEAADAVEAPQAEAPETEGTEAVESTETEAAEAVEPTEAEGAEAVEPTEAEAAEAVEPTEAEAAEAVEATETEATEAAEVTDAEPAAADAPTADLAAGTDESGAEEAQVAAEPTNPNFRWYVVHTYSGYENRAKQCLLDRIVSEKVEEYFGEILIPTEDVVEVKGGTKRTKTRKFFPGYIIVQMEVTDETWHVVKSTQKVTGFVGGTARKPSAIPAREVLRITQQMEDGTERPKPTQIFEQGQQVRIVDGPFLNFTGSVEEVRPEKQKIRVLVSIFGRATPVELDFVQVERV